MSALSGAKMGTGNDEQKRKFYFLKCQFYLPILCVKSLKSRIQSSSRSLYKTGESNVCSAAISKFLSCAQQCVQEFLKM